MKQLFRECLATTLAALLMIGLLPPVSRAAVGQRFVPTWTQQLPTVERPAANTWQRDVAREQSTTPPLLAALAVAAGVLQGTVPKETTVGALPGQRRTLLADGRWLITGGQGKDGPEESAWLLDSSGIAAKLPHGLLHARAWHTATLLPDGSVLILGGEGSGNRMVNQAERFTLEQLNFAPVNLSLLPRSHHTATLLLDGRLALAGGTGVAGTAVEFLNTATNELVGETTLKAGRQDHTATLFANGSVLFWGGTDTSGQPFAFGESLDADTNYTRFEPTRDDSASTLPARIEASIPPDRSVDVAIDTRIAVRFSRSIAVTSVTPASSVVAGPDGTVPHTVVSAEEGMLLFVQPTRKFQPGTTYTLTLHGLTDTERRPVGTMQLVLTTAGDGPDTKDKAKAPENEPSAEHLPPLQAPPGVTALTGRALMLSGKPLQGVTFRINEERARTDGTGRFLLTGLSAGHHKLVIDGRSVRAAETYGVFEVGVDITAGTTTVLDYTVWMPAIDTVHAMNLRFPTASETVVTTPLLPGLEFRLPAGTTITDIDGKVASQVSITPIPVNQPPFPLPGGGKNVPLYFTIQPGGGYIHVAGAGYKGARLFYPNAANDSPGTVFNFWSNNPEKQGWFVYGQGSVSPDRTTIVPNPGVEIHELTGAMVIPGGNGPGSGPAPGGGKSGGDPVDLGTGLFVYDKTDLAITDVIPLAVTRTYRQNDTRSRSFGIGTTFNYDMFLVGDVSPYTYIELVLPDGGRVRFERTSPGTGIPLGTEYQNTSSLGPFYGATITYHGVDWKLRRKDGTAFRFKDALFFNGPHDTGLLSITDRNGNVVTITRTNGNVTRVTSPNGRYIDFTYTSNRITQIQDNMGRTVLYGYDGSGRLTQVTDANNGIWTYDYDTAHRMTTIRDARNILYVTNHYDANGRVDLQTQADMTTYQFSYLTDGNGAVTQTDVTDPRGNVRRVVFNPVPSSPNGFVSGGYDSTDTHAFGTGLATTVTTQRNPGTNLANSITDALGRVTAFTYDPHGNVSSITRLSGTPNAVTTTFTYDATFGNVTSTTDALGHTTTFSYDVHGNVTTIIDQLGNRSAWTYNTAGQVLTATDPNGNVTTYGYSAGKLTSITDSLGRATILTYDALGRRTTSSTAYGTTMQEYNPLNLVTRITDAAGGITEADYDPNGNLLTVKDARNNITTYTYNNMDRLETRKDALLALESFVYDGNGNLVQGTDRRGKVTAHAYDALDRVSFTGFGTLPGPTYESSISYTYDGASRLTVAADSTTGNVTRGYDDLDRLTSEVTPQGTLTYTYDSADRKTSTTVTGQTDTIYTYDDVDRLTQITQGSAAIAFTYDAGGRKSSVTLPNGVVSRYTYNPASQLIEIGYYAGTTLLGNLTYTYDSAGQRSGLGGTFAQVNLPTSFTSAAYNANNQLTQRDGTSYTYDANGNLSGDGAKTYTWSARNQMSTLSGGVTASFQYDAFGRRTLKSVGGVATGYLHDSGDIIQELSGITPSANLITAGVDEVLTRTDSMGTSNYLTDALGSPIALTDNAGMIQTTYAYEPFGKTTTSGAGNANTYQYTGRENDGTGLYYYRSRYYDPALARFISEDPAELAGGDVNLYGYVAENPISFVDPSGSQRKWLDLGQGWKGGMDITPTRNPAGFEIHIYDHAGRPTGIISGQEGWIGRHKFPANVRPSGIPQDVLDEIHRINLERLVKAQKVPSTATTRNYLHPGRVYGFLPILSMLLEEWIATQAGRKSEEEKQKACLGARIPEAPEYVLTNLGPMPAWMAGCTPLPGA